MVKVKLLVKYLATTLILSFLLIVVLGVTWFLFGMSGLGGASLEDSLVILGVGLIVYLITVVGFIFLIKKSIFKELNVFVLLLIIVLSWIIAPFYTVRSLKNKAKSRKQHYEKLEKELKKYWEENEVIVAQSIEVGKPVFTFPNQVNNILRVQIPLSFSEDVERKEIPLYILGSYILVKWGDEEGFLTIPNCYSPRISWKILKNGEELDVREGYLTKGLFIKEYTYKFEYLGQVPQECSMESVVNHLKTRQLILTFNDVERTFSVSE